MLQIAKILLFSTVLADSTTTPIEVSDSIESMRLTTYVKVFEDPTGKLTQRDAQFLDENNWQSAEKNSLNFGFSDSTYWVRFSLKHVGQNSDRFYLEIAYPLLDSIDIHMTKNTQPLRTLQMGDAYPFSQRDLAYKNFITSFSMASGDLLDFTIKIKSASSVQIPIILWRNTAFSEENITEAAFLFILYGTILGLISYHCFIFLTTKDAKTFTYISYLAGHAIFQMSLMGLSFQYLWPNYPNFAAFSISFSFGLTVFFLSLYVKDFLILKAENPILDRIFKFLAINGVGIFIATPFVAYKTIVPYCALLSIIVPFLILIPHPNRSTKKSPLCS